MNKNDIPSLHTTCTGALAFLAAALLVAAPPARAADGDTTVDAAVDTAVITPPTGDLAAPAGEAGDAGVTNAVETAGGPDAGGTGQPPAGAATAGDTPTVSAAATGTESGGTETAGAVQPVPTATTGGGSPDVERVPVTETPMEATSEGDLISITLNDVEMKDVINMFIRISHANIIAAPTNLTGRVTVSLKNVEWKSALTAILDMNGLTLSRSAPESDVYSIQPKPEGAPEPMFIETFQLQYKRPDTLSDGVKLLLQPNGQLLQASGNMISVLGTSKQVEDVRSLLSKVDLRVPQVVIEAKFVELNDTAIKDMGVNWQSLQGYTIGVGNLQWSMQNDSSVRDANTRTARDYRNTAHTEADTRESSNKNDTSDVLKKFYDINGTQYEESTTTYEELPPGSGNYVPSVTRTPTRAVNGTDEALDSRTRTMSDTKNSGQEYEHNRTRENLRTFTDMQSAILTADAFAITLSALKQNSGADVISNPKIIVASGETASIHVGRQDPEIRAVADNNLSGRLTYERKDWIESGVRLEVTPIVNTEDIISVIIQPELSRVIGYQDSGDIRVQIPILSTRTIKSQFNLPSGQTVAIGGLTETQDKEQVSKVPLLGDIPIIGKYLFTHTHTERVQDEVIVFVTMALANPEELTGTTGLPSQETLLKQRINDVGKNRYEFIERDPKRRKQLERRAAEAAAKAAKENTPSPVAP